MTFLLRDVELGTANKRGDPVIKIRATTLYAYRPHSSG